MADFAGRATPARRIREKTVAAKRVIQM